MVEGAFELAAGALVAAVDPGLGGRIASLRVGGHEVLVVDGASPLEQGWYPMAPYAGRVRGGRFRVDDVEHQLPLTAWPNAIHGTVHSLPWDVDERSEASCTLSVGLGAGWPFAGRARHRIELADGGVRVELQVTSEGRHFPASCGWHPWLRRDLGIGGPAVITLHAGAMWERDDDHLPTGRLVPPGPGPWDDCFTELTWPTVVRWPGALTVEVVSSCEHVVVFDERPEGVCVEPQTGPPDALTIAPVLVTPERPLVAEAVYRFRADDAG
jgi:galactose mutarotase-like enzyme